MSFKRTSLDNSFLKNRMTQRRSIKPATDSNKTPKVASVLLISNTCE